MANTKKTTKKVTKKEPVVKEEFTAEEIKAQFFDTKDDKDSTFASILNVVLWIVLFIWIALCLIDFYKTRKGLKTLFTFKHEVVKYEDGEVESDLGLGYKVFNYKRKCFNGTEFGPFWSKDRSIEAENCNK